MARFAFRALVFAPLAFAACSIVNAPDDVNPGSGGAGNGGPTGGGPGSSSTDGSGASSVSSGGSGGTGGTAPPVCNNGVVEGDEACDDGNPENDDACSTDCEITQFDVAVDPTLGNEWPGVGTSGVDGGKGFFVVWRWLGPASEIRGRAFTASGEAVADPIKLSSSDSPGQARIGTNTDGRSIVSWPGPFAEDYIVHYVVVDPNGTVPATGMDKTITSSRANGLVSAGASDSGDFALVWVQFDMVSMTNSAKVRSFNPMGSLFNTATQDLGLATNSFDYPGVWGVKDGFVASWNSPGGNLGSWWLDPKGIKKDPPGMFNLATGGTDADANRNPFGAYVGPEDEFIAVFEAQFDPGSGSKSRIKRRRFTEPAVSTEAGDVVSSAHHNESNSRVARHSNGRFVVVWADGDILPENPDNYCRIMARVFQPNGQPFGADFQVSKDVKGCQSWPGVAVNVDGDAMFVWDSASGDDPVPTGQPYKISSKIFPRLMVK